MNSNDFRKTIVILFGCCFLAGCTAKENSEFTISESFAETRDDIEANSDTGNSMPYSDENEQVTDAIGDIVSQNDTDKSMVANVDNQSVFLEILSTQDFDSLSMESIEVNLVNGSSYDILTDETYSIEICTDNEWKEIFRTMSYEDIGYTVKAGEKMYFNCQFEGEIQKGSYRLKKSYSIDYGNRISSVEYAYVPFQVEDKGDIEFADPISVEIIQRDAVESIAGQENDLYDSEGRLNELDIEELNRQYGKKRADILNDHSKRTVQIYQEDYELLESFINTLESTYFTKKVPDFSGIYNLANRERYENMILVQTWGYEHGLAVSKYIDSCESTINIKNIDYMENGVREILFRWEQKVQSDGLDLPHGNWFFANLIDTAEGSKIINIWMVDSTFDVVVSEVKDTLKSKSIDDAMDILEKKVADKIEENHSDLNADPWFEDDNIPDE